MRVQRRWGLRFWLLAYVGRVHDLLCDDGQHPEDTQRSTRVPPPAEIRDAPEAKKNMLVNFLDDIHTVSGVRASPYCLSLPLHPSLTCISATKCRSPNRSSSRSLWLHAPPGRVGAHSSRLEMTEPSEEWPGASSVLGHPPILSWRPFVPPTQLCPGGIERDPIFFSLPPDLIWKRKPLHAPRATRAWWYQPARALDDRFSCSRQSTTVRYFPQVTPSKLFLAGLGGCFLIFPSFPSTCAVGCPPVHACSAASPPRRRTRELVGGLRAGRACLAFQLAPFIRNISRATCLKP